MKKDDPKNQEREKKRWEKSFDKYVKRYSTPKERSYVRKMLREFIENNVLNLDLLEFIPQKPELIEKTRFDQLYDAAINLVFPGYREETLQRLLGPSYKSRQNTKIWRCIFPEKFGITHVLIRANSFQEGFALASDYACRMSLRLYSKIPTDMTIRVQFVSEKALRRTLDMRWANRVKRRKELQLEGRQFTSKELTGARLAALGHNKQPEYSIFHYAEARDLKRIMRLKNVVRLSAIEIETFRSELPDAYRFKDE